MKNRLYLPLLAASLLLASCGDKLNVQPTQSVDENVAIGTDAGVKTLVVGAYDRLGGTSFLGGTALFAADLLADNGEVRFSGTFQDVQQFWLKRLSTSNLYVRDFWIAGYDIINRSNYVLANLGTVAEADRSRIEGEALFLRGTAYFYLVRYFGKAWNDGSPTTNLGVPITTTPTLVTGSVTDADNRSRNTVSEVYTQVLADLTRAESLLPATNGFFANKHAAAGMLSRVYLGKQDYANARDAANRVISSGNYRLAAAFGDAFNDKSAGYAAESVFRMVVTDQDGSNGMNTFYASPIYQGRGDVRVLNKHVALYPEGDLRGQFFYLTTGNTRRFTSKYADQYGDVTILRLAEMYLTRAECNLRLNASVGDTPLNDVNRVRSRAGLAPLAAVTLTQVLNERKLELAFEGEALFDAKRLMQAIGSLAYNAPSLVFPIPQREIDTNKALVQNEGY